MPPNIALAIAAHPDDIEFCMAGTLLRLAGVGWQIHCLNLSSGNLGSASIPGPTLARLRRAEARAAAQRLGAVWHPPIARDLEIFYHDTPLRQVAAVIRSVQPRILLTHSPQDYMEDHMNTCRIAVTAAFARAMPNYHTRPRRPAYDAPLTIYHALPHGLADALGHPVRASLYVDTTPVLAHQRSALACHVSQKEWLDHSQGMDSYLDTLTANSRAVGRLSRKFQHAEGWRRHSHLGFCDPHADPLREALPTASVLRPDRP